MIGKNNKITNIQTSVLMINTIIGVGILSLPNILAEKAGTLGWASVIASGLIVMALVYIITKLMEMYDGKTIFEISQELIGVPFTYIATAIFIIYSISISSFVIRIFGEVIKTLLLHSTPIHFVIITMLLTTSYIVRCGIETMARFTLIILPFFMIPIFIISLVLLPDLDYSNLMPMFRLDASKILKSIPYVFFSFSGFECLLVFMGYTTKTKASLKYNLLSIIAIIGMYLGYFIVSIARFGEEGLRIQIWPLLSLSKTVEFPSSFIENIDGVILAIWVLIVFTTLMSYLYFAALLISKILGAKEHKQFTLPIIPIVYVMSLVPQNIVQVYTKVDIFLYIFGGFTSILTPVFFFTLAKIKKKGGKIQDEKNI